jgi:prepilin-type N-terminal cleavage/methylation domain-containing protein
MMTVKNMQRHSQKGFTIVELIIAIAIIGLITPMLVSMLSQLSTSNSVITHRQIAINEIQNAIDRVSEDIFTAQSIVIKNSSGSQKSPDPITKMIALDLAGAADTLTMSYMEWNNTLHTVEYKLDNGGTLTRYNSILVSGQTTPTQSQTLIARSISTCAGTWDTNLKTMTLNVVATVGENHPRSESRTVQINPRPAQ